MAPVNSWVYDEDTGEYYAPGTYEIDYNTQSYNVSNYEPNAFLSSAGDAADTVFGSIGTAVGRAPAAISRFFGSGPANLLESAIRPLPFDYAQSAADALGAFADRTNRGADRWDQAALDLAGYDRGSSVDEAGGIMSSFVPAAMTAPLGGPAFIGLSGASSAGDMADRLQKEGASPLNALGGGLASGVASAGAAAVNLPFLQSTGKPLMNALGIMGTNAVLNPTQEIVNSGIERLATGEYPSNEDMMSRMSTGMKSAVLSGALPFVTPKISGRSALAPDAVNIDASMFDAPNGLPAPDAMPMGDPDAVYPPPQPEVPVADRAMNMIMDSIKNPVSEMQMSPESRMFLQEARGKTKLPGEGVVIDPSKRARKAVQQKSMPRPTDILVPPTGNVLEAYTPDAGPQRVTAPTQPRTSGDIVAPEQVGTGSRPAAPEVVARELADNIVRGAVPESAKKTPIINLQTMPRPELVLPKEMKALPAPDEFQLVGPVRNNPEVNPIGEKADFQQARLRENYKQAMPVMEANFDSQYVPPATDPISNEQYTPDNKYLIDDAIRQRRDYQQTRQRGALLKAAEAIEGQTKGVKFDVQYPKYSRIDGARGATEVTDGFVRATDKDGNVHSVSLDVDFQPRATKIKPGSKKEIVTSSAPRTEKIWRVMDAGPDGLPVTVADKLTADEARRIGKLIVSEKIARAGQLAPGNVAAKVDPAAFEVPVRGFKGESLVDAEVQAKLEARDPQPKLRAKVLSGQRGVLNVGDIVDAITAPFKELSARKQLRKEGVQMSPKDEALRGWTLLRDLVGEESGTKLTNIARSLDQWNTWAEKSPELRAGKIFKENESALARQVDTVVMPHFTPMLELGAGSRRRVSDAAHKVFDVLLQKRTADPSGKYSVDSISDAYLTKAGLDANEIAALRGIWKGFDAALPFIAETLKSDAPDVEAFPNAHEEYVKRVDEAIRTLKGIGYVPRTRAGSEFLVRGKTKEGDPLRFQFDSASEAKATLEQIKEAGGEAAIEKMARDAKVDWTTPNLSAELNNALAEFTLNKFKSAVDKGGKQDSFIRHLVSARNVKGYDADLTMPILQYVEGLGNWRGRKLMQKPLERLKASINPKGDEKGGAPELARRLDQYLDFVDSKGSKLTHFFSRLVDLYSLAGVTSSGVINLLQAQNTFASAFARAGMRGVRNALRASKFSFTNDLKSVPAEVRDVVGRAMDTGVIDSGAFLERSKLQDSAMERGTKLLMKTFSIPESVTRRNAFLTGALIGHDAGLKGDALLQYSREFLTDNMGDYAKTNASLAEMNLPRVGGLMLKYKKYMINQMRLMRRLATKEGGRGKAALGGLLLSQAVIAGLSGLPWGKETKRAMEMAGFEPDKIAEELMGSKSAGQALMYGIPSEKMGIDLSASAGFGNIVPELGEDPYGAIFSTIVGPSWQFADRAKRMYGMYGKDADSSRWAEQLAPRFMRGPIREYELQTKGEVRDADNNLIANKENAIPGLTALGFTPPNAREQYQERKDIQKIQDEANIDTDYFNLRMAKALFEGSEDKKAAIIKQIQEHNKAAIAEGKPWKVRRLDRDSIMMHMARMKGGDAALAALLRRTKKSARGAVADRYNED